MVQYHELLKKLLDAPVRQDRTGTGAHSAFGYQMRFNLRRGFPLITTKKMFFKGIVHELLWFLSGNTNISYLKTNGVHIWDEWANENGELGPVYGHQWRTWGLDSKKEPIDQIGNVIASIKQNPYSRRHIVSAWNVADLEYMALPPCHLLFQFYVSEGELSCMMTQRSADVFLGLPFNIASYALLTHMIAQVCDLKVGDLIISIGDAHLYTNHIEQAKKQITRTSLSPPVLRLNPEIKDIDSFQYKDIELLNYSCHTAIKAPISI